MYQASAFISGIPISPNNKITIKSPLDGSPVGTVPALEEEHIKEAFASAREAFSKWSMVDHQTRCKYLMEFASKLREHAPVLSQIVHMEVGKDLKSAHEEVIRSADYIVETVHAYSEMVEKPEEYNYENNILVPKGINATYLRVPHGVALTISPFNYPVNLMITKIVPAIITGNTVVHKSATHGSIAGWYISRIFNDLSVDEFLITPGVLNYVTGSGSSIGNWLVGSNMVDVFSFTGSTEIGKSLASSFPLIPVQLELGGHNPAIVFEDANLELALKEIIKGAFGFSGQRCTSVKRLFVQKKIYGKFLEALEKKLNNISLQEPLITKRSVERLEEFCQDALSKGAEYVGKPLEMKGNYVTPVVFRNVTEEMKVFSEELFAPIMTLVSFENVDDMVKMCNDSKYGLQASLFTSNLDKAVEISLKLEFGRVNINGSPSRSPDIFPFSGIKDSGKEVQGIKNSLYFFTRFKGLVSYKKD